MNWQKRARLAAAIVGIASAVGVYAVMGDRAKPVPAAAPARVDPRAVIESQGNILQQVRGTRQDYVIEAAQQLTYEGGATKLRGVKVSVKNRGGRDFVITAAEAQAGEREEELRLNGDVTLAASDGFQITTTEAFFSERDGTVRAPQRFEFRRGRMAGFGEGMSYDKNNDVLSITNSAEVRLFSDVDNSTVTMFTAGSAVFTRPSHVLALSGAVHVLHHEQKVDAEQAVAHLTDDDARIAVMELRGKAEVTGTGQGLDAMNADAIDIDYAEDGATIDRVKLTGAGRVAMSNGDGGRRISGNLLDMALAPDGAITNLIGRDGVRLELDARAGTSARAVSARSLDAAGESGKGLTSTRFQEAVEYREEAGPGSAARVVRSSALDIVMANDAIESAVFTGGVRFEQDGLQGAGGRALYEPVKNSLRIMRGSEPSMSRLADEQVTVEATTIDVALESRKMAAEGSVKTTLRSRPAGGNAPARGGGTAKVPGLLKQDQPVNVNASAFTYGGGAGQVVYTGGATLFQGETAIRADQIAIDQEKGDLAATGDARSTIALDTGASVGRAPRITYADADRLIRYEGTAGSKTPPVAPVLAQVSGPQGDLRAVRIEIVLAQGGGKAERLEAYTDVDLAVDRRKAAGARLTYFSADERYVITGTATAPVKVVENCREILGRTLIFFKATDRIIVDGNEEIRTQTTNGGPCAPSPPRPR